MPTAFTWTPAGSTDLELDHYNGVGGDNCEATAAPTGFPPANGADTVLAGGFIGCYVSRCAYVAFTEQPASVTNAPPFLPVTFAAAGVTESQTGIVGTNDPAAGTNNFMLFQWTINGTAVPGASTSSFSMVADPWFNNAQVVCQIRALGYANGAGTPIWSNSTPAVLTVATNSVVPAISYANVFRQNGGKTVLDIRFNKPMNPASLLNATYSLPGYTLGAMNVFTNGSINLSPTSEAITLDQYASIQSTGVRYPTFPLTLAVSGAEDAWAMPCPQPPPPSLSRRSLLMLMSAPGLRMTRPSRASSG